MSEVLYCSIQEVRDWLGDKAGKLSDEFIKMLILEKMDYIDRLSGTSWGGRVKRATTYADFTRWKYGFLIGIGIPVYLPHRYVKRIVSLRVISGADYEEWIDKMEYGRGKGYWLDEINGVLYIRIWTVPAGGKEMKITYEYGRDDLPDYVKELCRLLVIRDLLIRERKQFIVPEGAEAIRIGEMLEWVERRIIELEERIRDIAPVASFI